MSGIIPACDQHDEVKTLKALQNSWLCHWLLGGQDKVLNHCQGVKRKFLASVTGGNIQSLPYVVHMGVTVLYFSVWPSVFYVPVSLSFHHY